MESIRSFIDEWRLKIGVSFIILTGLVIISFGIFISINHPEYRDPMWLRWVVGSAMILGMIFYGKKSVLHFHHFWIASIPIFPGWSLLMLYWNNMAPRYMITAYLIILGYSAVARNKKALTYFVLGYLSSVSLIGYIVPKTQTPLGDVLPTLIFASAVIYTICLILLFLRDAYIQHEEQLLAQYKVLENTNKELTQAKELAELSSRAKTRFLSVLSHELRTPLNAIVGFTELIGTSLEKTPQQDSIEGIRKASSGMLFQVDTLLALLGLEKSRWCIKNEIFDLEVFAKKQIEEMNNQYSSHPQRIDFQYRLPPHLNTLLDPFLLGIIIKNLLSNALKFSPSQSPVIFKIEIHHGLTHFTISDQGIGITQDKLSTIQNAFHQIDDSTTRSFGGLGVGLSVCQKALECLNSELLITSSAQNGSTFQFSLNLNHQIQTTEESSPTPSAQTIEIQINPTPKNILLVEDNAINAKIARRFLEKWDYEVTWAENGQIAVDLVKEKGPFYAILMDMHMPIMDGVAAIKTIRALDDSSLNSQNIIILTASVTGNSSKELGNTSIQGFLTKPIDSKKLKQSLEDL